MALAKIQYLKNTGDCILKVIIILWAQVFLQRLQALKTPDVIYIHTINHFLNGVSSFQMHCVTPEWKGLSMTHGFKNTTRGVFLAHAANNYLIAGDFFLF